MAIPYTNRSATFDVPDFALKKLSEEKIMLSANAIIDDFSAQFASLVAHVECITQVSAKGFRATFKSAQALEEAIHSGVTIRGFPLTLRPVSTYRWVTIRRLPYGIPGEEIVRALAPHGTVIRVKSELYKGVYNGDRSALMDMRSDIASLLRIKGHNCQIFYRGQPRTCFRCGQQGHESKVCPGRAKPAAQVEEIVPQQEDKVCDDSNKTVGTKRTYNEIANGDLIPSTSHDKTVSTISQKESEDEYESSHEETLVKVVLSDKKKVKNDAISEKVPSEDAANKSDSEADIADESATPNVFSGAQNADMLYSGVGIDKATPNTGNQSTADISATDSATPNVFSGAQSADIPLAGADIKIPMMSPSDSESDIADDNIDIPNKVPVPKEQRGSKSRRRKISIKGSVIPSRVPTRPRLPYSGGEKAKRGDKGSILGTRTTVSGVAAQTLKSAIPALQCRRKGKKSKAPSGDL